MKNGDYKIGIEKRMSILETKIDELINNHLHSLEKKIDRINWFVLTALIGIIINIIFKL